MAKTEVILTHNIVGLGGESDQVESWLEAGIQKAMSQFNGVVGDSANEGKAQ